MIAPEVIQKINLLGAARSVRSAARNFGAGVRVGATHAYPVARAGGRDTLHVVANRAGLAGVRTGIRVGVGAGHAVRVLAPRVAAARARASRIGASLRSRRISPERAQRIQNGLDRAEARARARATALTRSGNTTYRRELGRVSLNSEGRGVRAVRGAVNAGRVWVHNARVAGGGFWRRLRGG